MSIPARIVCIPSQDAPFVADAARLAAAIPPDLAPDDALRWFERELRRSYPTAMVREQDDLARTGEERVWYVTRRRHHFRIDTSVEVPLRPDEAYAVYVDRVVEWQTAVDLVAVSKPGDAVGTEYEASYLFLGRRYAGRFRVVGSRRPRWVALEASGSGITVWYVTRFEPAAAGTRVTVRGDYDLPSNVLSRIADRLGLERAIGRDIVRANETYLAMCEQVARSGTTG